MEDKLGKYSEERAKVYQSLGMVFLKLNEMDIAEWYYIKALKIREYNFGKDHILTADLYNDIGYLYFK